VFDVWGSAPTDVWIVGEAGFISHSAGDGNWSPNQAPPGFTANLYDISGSPTRTVVAGDLGQALANVGAGWIKVDTMSTTRLLAVWQGNNEILFAGLQATYIDLVVTGDTQMQWPGVTGPFDRIWGVPEDVYIVGDTVVLRRLNDGPWNATAIDPMVTLWGLWGASLGDLYAVGDDATGGPHGVVYHSTGVDDWTRQNAGQAARLTAVSGSAADDLWAVGLQGTVRHSSGGGADWAPVTVPSTVDFYGVWASATDLYVVGDQSTILHGRRR
jgi:hypothetical protein